MSNTDKEEAPAAAVALDSPSETSMGTKPIDDHAAKYEEIRPVVSELTDEDRKRAFDDAVFLLMEHPDDVLRRIVEARTMMVPGGEEHLKRYKEAIENSVSNHPKSSEFKLSPFNRDDSLWRQAVNANGDELMAGRPRFDNQKGALTGDAALFRVRSSAGLGTVINVPLWHTGIWVKLKAPSESVLLELERRMSQDKMELGRRTSGVAFTNAAVYLNSHLVNMILNHVYDATFKDRSVRALKNVIRVTDIPQLIWGSACTIWPNGYRLVRPCVHNHEKCTHIDEAHVNLSKLTWVDNRAISNYQRNMMTSRDSIVTGEQIEQYRNEHIAPQSKVIKLNDQMSVKLEVPSIADYENAGFRWVDNIIKMTDEAFGQTLRGDERNQYITHQAQITHLRRYSHWVREIMFVEDNAAIIDRTEIDIALDNLSGNNEIATKLINDIEEFIKNSVISAIGIPKYKCPSCQKDADESQFYPRLNEIIQLEVNEIFFTLQFMRIKEVLGLETS